MNLLEKNINEFTLEEFFTFLDMKKEEIILIRKSFLRGLSMYENCCKKEEYVEPISKSVKTRFLCYQSKIEEMLKTKEKKDILKLLFMHVLGEKFFELSEKEMDVQEKQGYFTKKSIDKLFEGCIANYYGKPIVSPESFDDIISNVENLIGIIQDKAISNSAKEKYLISLNRIETLIANKYAKMSAHYEDQLYTIETINDVVKKFKNNKKITIDEEEKFKELLNKNILVETTHDDGTKTYEPTNYGNITIDCIEKYNEEIKIKLEEKEKNKRANKFYKTIKKASMNKLEKEIFPSYDDVDVVDIYRKLFELFENDLSKNSSDDLITKYVLTQMQYAGYFKSTYYDKEKVFGKEK